MRAPFIHLVVTGVRAATPHDPEVIAKINMPSWLHLTSAEVHDPLAQRPKCSPTPTYEMSSWKNWP